MEFNASYTTLTENVFFYSSDEYENSKTLLHIYKIFLILY